MAIDFPASPTNGQTFTSGSVTYTWDGTKWTAVAAAGSSNSITQGNTNATVTDTGSDGRFVVTTEGSERLRVDSSGRLGIGTTSPGTTLEVAGAVRISGNANLPAQTNSNAVLAGGFASPESGRLFIGDGTGWRFLFSTRNASVTADKYLFGDRGTFEIRADSGEAPFIAKVNASEVARIDSSGRLLVGTTNPLGEFAFQASNSSKIDLVVANAASFTAGTDQESRIVLGKGYNNALTPMGVISSRPVDPTSGANGVLTFSTRGNETVAERMRIGSNGFSKFSNTGSYLDGGGSNEIFHEFSSDKQSQPCLRVHSSNASFDGYACLQVEVQRNTTNDTFKALRYYNRGAGTERFVVADDGDVRNTNNSYAGLSDIKLKENIIEASSQWDDLKALQVRKYNFKPETGESTHTQIGLIAQEVELVSPGLVSESPDRDAEGNDLGTVTKSVNYSVLYMKAVKALQEAMERIETLEAKVAALESPTTALEIPVDPSSTDI